MSNNNVSDDIWSLTIRLSNGERFIVDTALTGERTTVGSFKSIIQSRKEELIVSRQRLVYKGRILEDDERLLTDYGVVNKSTLFLVMKSVVNNTTSNNNSGSSSSNPIRGDSGGGTPMVSDYPSARASSFNPMNPMQNLNSANNPMGGGGAGSFFPGMPSTDPTQMRDFMNSPMMQSLMENPQAMQAAMEMSLQMNPQLRELMERNPELRQVMQDPQMMQQAMNMMRNPDAMQQAMRSQELAMSQIENMPGGFAALSSMYRNIQEPLMEAQQAGSTSQTSSSSATSSTSQSQGEGATGAAMPNPWGNRSRTTTSNSDTTRATPTTTSPAMSNPWSMPSSSSGAMPPAFPFPNMPGLPPGQQHPPNPDQLLQILDNPFMAQMMEQMVDSNPDMIRTMMEQQNPMLFRQMFGGDTQAANQFIRQMMNPQSLRQTLQFQQMMSGRGGDGPPGGAGGMFGGMMPPFFPPPTPTTGSNANNATPPAAGSGGLDFSNLLSSGSMPSGNAGTAFDFGSFLNHMQSNSSGFGGSSTGTQQQRQQQHPMMDFGWLPQSSMMQPQGGNTGTRAGAGTGTGGTQHPADRFRSQLNSLRDMGFDDEQANLAVLQQNHGNLNRAVDQLLMGPPPPPSLPSSSSSSAAVAATAPPAPSPPQPQEETSEMDNSTPKPSEDKKND